ncbi:MAG: pilin [Wohlfahrtiimonas sp.]
MKQGFTLIELMIVVGIIGILSMLALPAYQDYTKRTYIAEGLSLAGGLKNEIMDFYTNEGRWPWLYDLQSDYIDGNINSYKDAAQKNKKIQGQGIYDIKPSISYLYNFSDGTNGDDRGMITIFYNEKIDASFQPPTYASQVYPTNELHLVLATNSDLNKDGISTSLATIQWNCVAKGKKILAKWLPANCREQIYANSAISPFESDNPDDQWWKDMWKDQEE